VAASGRYCSRFCIARPAEVEWQHPVATAHGSALRALRRWSARSGRYRSRFCIGRPAEVEWQRLVATAHGSVTTRQRRTSQINSMTVYQ
jgi:hypothetical protein